MVFRAHARAPRDQQNIGCGRQHRFALSGRELLAGNAVQAANFFAGDPQQSGGIRLAVKDLDGDTRADLVTGDGTGSTVRGYLGTGITPTNEPDETLTVDGLPGFSGGVFVG